MVLITVLVGDYVGNLAQVPLAVGWMAFFSGITGLTRPLIIGRISFDPITMNLGLGYIWCYGQVNLKEIPFMRKPTYLYLSIYDILSFIFEPFLKYNF